MIRMIQKPSVETRKIAASPDAPGYANLSHITNEVTTHEFTKPITPRATTDYPISTADLRMMQTIPTLLFLLSLVTTMVSHANDFIVHEAQNLALQHVTLIDGTGAKPMNNVTVLVSNAQITGVLESHAVIPDNYRVLALPGHTVTPGLVMLHEHLFYPTGLGNYSDMVHSFPSLYLAGGATTIRTAGTMAPYADINISNAIANNTLLGPDIDVTAPYLNGPGLPIMKIRSLQGADDAENQVNYWLSEGVNSYKLYMHIRQDEMQRIIGLAHQNRQKVTGHLCSVTFREAADLGIDNLEHGFVAATDFVENKQKDVCPSRKATMASLLALPVESKEITALIQHLVKNKVALTSTLTIYETFAKGRPMASPEALAVMNQDVKQQYLARWSAIQAGESQDWSNLLKREMAWEKQFVAAGGHLVVGTDPTGYGGVVAGWSNLRAIELLVESGFSLPHAIKIATLNGAQFLERDNEIGTVETGKRANLAIFSGDLSEHLTAIKKIKWTVKNGVFYDSQAIFSAMQGKVGLH